MKTRAGCTCPRFTSGNSLFNLTSTLDLIMTKVQWMENRPATGRDGIRTRTVASFSESRPSTPGAQILDELIVASPGDPVLKSLRVRAETAASLSTDALEASIGKVKEEARSEYPEL